MSDSSMFITLTYDTKHVPITQSGFLDLRKSDLQKFFKRLRKHHPKESRPIRYYAAGEYGGKSYRPHYHIILFNAMQEFIPMSWTLGHIHYGKVTAASIGYTLKYICKTSRVPMHRNDDRTPEFALMSKGLGKSYLENRTFVKWHQENLTGRYHLNIEEGKKIALPRYYKERLYTPEQLSLIRGHLKGQLEAESLIMELDPNYSAMLNDKQHRTEAAFRRLKFDADARSKI